MPIYKQSGKKNGLQKYRVIVSFTNNAGEHKQLSRIVYGLNEARQAEADLLSECNKPAAFKMTVNDLFARYCAAKKMDIRPSTLNLRESTYKNRIKPFIGDLRVDRLNAAALEQWKASVNDLPLALATKKETFATLKMILQYAEAVDLLNDNPLKKISNFRDKDFELISSGDIKYYTPEQFAAYIAAAKAEAEQTGNWNYYLFFSIAYLTGMRKSEIKALKWNAIENGVFHIRQNITLNNNKKTTVAAVKTLHSLRDIRVSPQLNELLFRQKTEQSKAPSFSDDYFVIGGADPISNCALHNHHCKYVAAAGLPYIRIHDFRHSHASLLINEGISIQEVARRLGHSNVEITWKIYAHLYPREEERALKVLERIKI